MNSTHFITVYYETDYFEYAKVLILLIDKATAESNKSVKPSTENAPV